MVQDGQHLRCSAKGEIGDEIHVKFVMAGVQHHEIESEFAK